MLPSLPLTALIGPAGKATQAGAACVRAAVLASSGIA